MQALEKWCVTKVAHCISLYRDKSSGSQLLSDDMRRELARQEWEQRELETMEAEKSGPIHYSDVRHNGKLQFNLF